MELTDREIAKLVRRDADNLKAASVQWHENSPFYAAADRLEARPPALLTKLEQFTMAAMQGLLSYDDNWIPDNLDEQSVKLAKATLAQLAETDT